MQDKKEKIVSILKVRGPSLPIKLSKDVGLSMLFTSALLSEMMGDKMIKCSYMKIGSSPLYYLEGQEEMLNNFYRDLARKEQEAFMLLQKNKILIDTELEPAIRVALRDMKDFATLLRINYGGKEVFFWKFHTVNTQDASGLIKELMQRRGIVEKKIEEIKKIEEKKVESIKMEETPLKIKKPKQRKQKPLAVVQYELDIWGEKKPEKEEKKPKKEEIGEIKAAKEKPKKTKKILELDEKIKKYFEANSIIILEEIDRKKENFYIVKISSELGELKFLAVPHNKKSLSKEDILGIYNEGLNIKMPVLLITKAKISPKLRGYIKGELKGYIVIKEAEF
ncbi:hypothetical protein AUJ10_00540 [Candidatus Pacearchaeota archaeon CG1_02_31_27]|nr:MAG: hypothetical protein AUJ10_00540 [Candidatus Pacearchaeota archaeon CG1_02_31_27]PIN92307.1 MAG: hypothetical protein COU55_00645 [Candidatus Pacearchaeota archaeon CG10_big_fil_rev_8_21_14_0_10_31_59]PIZ79974.1 MAG: hypothetical protein COX99_03280 [Candidatus Pacearchaeota archaeon CG_4_10_14_0_2_um_filter_31_10]